MRSDSEDIPGGFTREEADRAETQEAEEQAADAGIGVQANPTNCRTYWPSPFKVCGKIREKYDAMGGPASFLTWPRSDEMGVPDGVGRRNEFVNGFIYWHPSTGAHPITTHFSLAYDRNGWEAGGLGYPTSDEFVTPNGAGRKQEFQNGGIYGSPVGLAAVQGRIYDKYVSMGASDGNLSFPVEDEKATGDGQGRFSQFLGGKMYWHATAGAHPVSGLSEFFWQANGGTSGKFGFPTSDPRKDNTSAFLQDFQKATLDLTKEVKDAGAIKIGNKDMSKIVVDYMEDYAARTGVPFPPEALDGPTVFSGDGLNVVPIPDDYVYDPDVAQPVGRHDYCTNSPDEFPAPGVNAKFHGACAVHDMCMDTADERGLSYGKCNAELNVNLRAICKEVYETSWDARRLGCYDAADGYLVAVTVTHPAQ
ncbi:hypothetical protein [Corynebacterium sp.]|uniref:LGFP repeat-containing protein n=1 Tax=Corynebacterium sp. TaxID=1720 RepID=UPI0028A8F005|nr:hypothetical protein [Corynebacterium sp.]